jgi:hypothetical protein
MCEFCGIPLVFLEQKGCGSTHHHQHMHVQGARTPLVLPQHSWTFVFSVQRGCESTHHRHHMHMQAARKPLLSAVQLTGIWPRLARANVVGTHGFGSRTLHSAHACIMHVRASCEPHCFRSITTHVGPAHAHPLHQCMLSPHAHANKSRSYRHMCNLLCKTLNLQHSLQSPELAASFAKSLISYIKPGSF